MAKKKNIQDLIFTNINISLMLIILIITLYPFWYSIVISFNDADNLLLGPLYVWPRIFTFDNYAFVLSNPLIGRAFVNSILRTIIGTSLHCLITGMAAFGLSKKELVGRKIYTTIFVITMYFSGGMIPTYLLIRSLGLLNNFLVYIIPLAFSFYHTILFMVFFITIPNSLEESAKIDGAGVLCIFFRIIFPVALPIFATIALFSGVQQWNSWYDTMVYTTSRNLVTLQGVLTRMLRQVESMEELQSMLGQSGVGVRLEISPITVRVATMVITTFPIVIIYPFLQKYFVKGIMLGSVKG